MANILILDWTIPSFSPAPNKIYYINFIGEGAGSKYLIFIYKGESHKIFDFIKNNYKLI